MSNARRSEPKLRALLIGCGRIGGRNDEGRGDETPTTHAGCYAAHPGFELVACIEPDKNRRRDFMRYWKVSHGFSDLAAFAASGISVDIASLCAPSERHGALLKELLSLPMKLVFCEKPLTTDLEEGRAIGAEYARAGRPLAVNYTRRWNRSVIELRRDIADGKWGRLLTAAGSYTKGILNNGSHLIDLLRFLAGEMEVVAVTGRRNDWMADDPTVDAVLRTVSGAHVHLIGADARAYYMFELSLTFEKGIVALENAGARLRVRRAVDVSGIQGEREPGEAIETETGWREQFLDALDNIHDAVLRDAPLASDATSALSAHAICADLAARAKSAPILRP